jgi:hypothetical protein
MTQHHDQLGVETFRRELDAADLRRRHDVPRHPNDEQIAQSLVENDLRRNA